MVKNKGFLPSGPSEISVQRKQIKAIVHSLLPACTEPDMDSGVPFHPHAIIANPPAYGKRTHMFFSPGHYAIFFQLLSCWILMTSGSHVKVLMCLLSLSAMILSKLFFSLISEISFVEFTLL